MHGAVRMIPWSATAMLKAGVALSRTAMKQLNADEYLSVNLCNSFHSHK